MATTDEQQEQSEQVAAAGWDAVSDPNGTLTAGPRPLTSTTGGRCVIVCRHPPGRKRWFGVAFRSRPRWVSCPECGKRAVIKTPEMTR